MMHRNGLNFAPEDGGGAAATDPAVDAATGGNAADAGAATAALAGEGAAAPAAPASFRDALSDDIRDHEALANIESVNDLAKEHINAQKLIGAKGIILPGDDATQEERDKFYNALGRPEKIEGYDVPIPEGYEQTPVDIAVQEAMLPIFHQFGATKDQVAGIVTAYNKITMDLAQKDIDARATAGNEAMAALKGEWGPEFTNKSGLAKRAATAFAGVEDLDTIEKIIGTAELMKMFHNIGARMGDAGALPSADPSTLGLSKEAAQERIKKFESDRETTKILTDANHPRHAEVVAERSQLYKIAFPENVRSD